MLIVLCYILSRMYVDAKYIHLIIPVIPSSEDLASILRCPAGDQPLSPLAVSSSSTNAAFASCNFYAKKNELLIFEMKRITFYSKF